MTVTPEQRKLVSKYSQILTLKDHLGWQLLIEDVKLAHDEIASGWCNIPEGSDALREARVKQLSNRYLLDVLDVYKAMLSDIQLDIIKEDNPGIFIGADVDNDAQFLPDTEDTGDKVYE